jgi:hypothetical protein
VSFRDVSNIRLDVPVQCSHYACDSRPQFAEFIDDQIKLFIPFGTIDNASADKTPNATVTRRIKHDDCPATVLATKKASASRKVIRV